MKVMKLPAGRLSIRSDDINTGMTETVGIKPHFSLVSEMEEAGVGQKGVES